MGLKKVRVPSLFVKYFLHSPHISDFYPKKMKFSPFCPTNEKTVRKNALAISHMFAFRGGHTFSSWHTPAAPRKFPNVIICPVVRYPTATGLLPLIGALMCAAALFLQICNA